MLRIFTLFAIGLPLWAAPKFTKEHIARIEMASEVPHPIDAFQYRVTGTFNGMVYYASEVPLWKNSSGLYEVEKIAVGTTIVLDYVWNPTGRNYYGLKKELEVGGRKVEDIVWIDGRFVEIAGAK